MARTSTTPSPEPARISATLLDGKLFQPLAMEDVVDIACFSRDACKRLPSEADIEKECRDDQVRPLIVEGARVIRFMAGEAGQPEPDEVQAALVRFVQIDAMLTIAGGATQGSCIGDAQADKKKCQADCKNSSKKFCGCFWNSFLAKSNCFITIGNLPLP